MLFIRPVHLCVRGFLLLNHKQKERNIKINTIKVLFTRIILYLYSIEIKKNNLKLSIMTVSASTILDVKIAHTCATESELIKRTWLYAVDPETMDEIRLYWKTLSGNKSMFNAFCTILKMGKDLTV